MKLEKTLAWLDKTLNVAAFDDVSNNGLQVDPFSSSATSQSDNRKSNNQTISTVAFAVDASVRAVEAAAAAGAELLVVHHGISWGGGIRRLTGGVGNVVRTAIENGVAVAAYHLPLDAHPTLGNNAQLAKLLGLRKVRPAFSYHGNVIGVVGTAGAVRSAGVGGRAISIPKGMVGVCSGGAGEFAEEAKALGCDVYLTGEASWGDVIAAENCGMKMVCAGHYETEVFGVRALAKAMKRTLKLRTVDLTDILRRS